MSGVYTIVMESIETNYNKTKGNLYVQERKMQQRISETQEFINSWGITYKEIRKGALERYGMLGEEKEEKEEIIGSILNQIQTASEILENITEARRVINKISEMQNSKQIKSIEDINKQIESIEDSMKSERTTTGHKIIQFKNTENLATLKEERNREVAEYAERKEKCNRQEEEHTKLKEEHDKWSEDLKKGINEPDS